MKTMSTLFLLLALLAPAQALIAADAGETWILSGQSNACGCAKGDPNKPDPRVTMFDIKSGKFVTAAEPFGMMGNIGLGPWHAAALEVAEKSNVPIRLTGSAYSGQPLSNWNDGQPGWNSLSLIVPKSGEGAGVFLWYQGESDALGGAALAEKYQENLKVHVERVRALAKNPKLLVVIIQLAGTPSAIDTGVTVREGQRQFVIADGNAILIPALGQPMQDGWHLNREGYFDLGKHIARALLKLRYRQDKSDGIGPVMDAALPGTDDKTVIAHFAEVKKLAGAAAEDFAVIDGSGTARCTKVQAQSTRAVFTFERAIKTPAKLLYGYGPNPKATLVDEAGNHAPAVMLNIAPGPMPDDKETKAPNGAGAAGPAAKAK